jgi:hypothetical protein
MFLRIGSELISGSAELIDAGKHYAGSALIRQLVEVEYLAWHLKRTTRMPLVGFVVGVAARFVQNCTLSLFSAISGSGATVGYEQDVNLLSHYTPGKISLILHD